MRFVNRLTPGGAAHPSERGLTLIELMVAIAVVAILLAAGAPYLGDYVRNSRLREAGTLLHGETLMAQSEAIKRNTTVRVSTNAAVVQVLDLTDASSPVVLRERTLPGGVLAPTSTLDFAGEGRPAPFGTSGSIDLSLPGTTCSSDVRCPGLRVDAGGAVRLCGNYQLCT